MQANQLRLWLSAMAYVLVDTLRRVGLTQFADAAAATIRHKLLKLGAQVRTSVRRIHFALASGCPNKVEFEIGVSLSAACFRLLLSGTPSQTHQGSRRSERRRAPIGTLIAARSANLKSQRGGLDLRTHSTRKMAFAGLVRAATMFEFEKSRLGAGR
jgi:hypothetical protein